MFYKNLVQFLGVLLGATSVFASADLKETEEKTGQDALLVLYRVGDIAWPEGVSKAVGLEIEPVHTTGVYQKYRSLEEMHRSAYAGMLASFEKQFKKPSYSHGLAASFCQIVERMVNEGYIPAVIRLSAIFQDGLYGFPQDLGFATQLLKSVPFNAETINLLDASAVRLILRCNLLKDKSLVPAARVLNNDSFTLGDFVRGSIDAPKVVADFKKPECYGPLLAKAFASSDEGVTCDEDKKFK
jgi:hypothetical protein